MAYWAPAAPIQWVPAAFGQPAKAHFTVSLSRNRHRSPTRGVLVMRLFPRCRPSRNRLRSPVVSTVRWGRRERRTVPGIAGAVVLRWRGWRPSRRPVLLCDGCPSSLLWLVDAAVVVPTLRIRFAYQQ